MAVFNAFRETALPGTLLPYSVYYVAPPLSPGVVEIYVTDSTGAVARRTPTIADINQLISDAIASLSEVLIVDDIAERDALSSTTNQQVLVLDATGDNTVALGAATYIYNSSNSTWVKISEKESLDLILQWANIQNKPTSTVAQIDAAVTASHSHTNKTQLDKIGEDGNGNFTYNGSLPKIAWSSTDW